MQICVIASVGECGTNLPAPSPAQVGGRIRSERFRGTFDFEETAGQRQHFAHCVDLVHPVFTGTA